MSEEFIGEERSSEPGSQPSPPGDGFPIPGPRRLRFVFLGIVLLTGACLQTPTDAREEAGARDTLAREGPDAPDLQVEVQGFPPMDTIPNLAASVVAAPRPADERVRRFFDELGAARFELVLSLADLNEARSNYPFEDAAWRQMVRSVHSVRGSVLLRLADVPRRLRAEEAGRAGPLSGPTARAEWDTIVGEVVRHFARRPESRIDELAGPRAPDRTQVWGDASGESGTRGAAFARHWSRTVAAARSVDDSLRVSGPGVALDGELDSWWDDALEGMEDPSELGFFPVSLPGPEFGPAWSEGVERVRMRLDAFGRSDAPVLVSGWGLDRDALPGTLSRSRVEASHVVAGYIRLARAGLRHTLGRGLDRRDPILAGDGPGLFVERSGELRPTPAYNALRMVNLAEVGGLLDAEVSDPELKVLAGIDALGRISVVVTRYRPLDRSGGEIEEADLSDVRTVRLHVDKLPSSSPAIELAWIDERRGNVWKGGPRWAELGAEPQPGQVGPWVTLDLRMPIYSVVVLRLTPL